MVHGISMNAVNFFVTLTFTTCTQDRRDEWLQLAHEKDWFVTIALLIFSHLFSPWSKHMLDCLADYFNLGNGEHIRREIQVSYSGEKYSKSDNKIPKLFIDILYNKESGRTIAS